jgi:hypothetical protein
MRRRADVVPFAPVLLAAVVTLGACEGESDRAGMSEPDGGARSQGERTTLDAGPEDAARGDASHADTSDGAAPDAATPRDGGRQRLDLQARFGDAVVTFDRAQFGYDSAGSTLYLEAHAGGDPACPTGSSPTPGTTLVVSGIPMTDGTSAEVSAALFDYDGQLMLPPVVRAASATASSVRHVRDERLALDFHAEAEGGVIEGHIAATHCATLDQPASDE